MIKFAYFDVGGVVIRDFSDTNKWSELRAGLGLKDEQDKEFRSFFKLHEPEVCVGKDLEALVPLLANKFGIKFPQGYSLLMDFVKRFERNESIWPLIEKAKAKYKVGLLTNMYPGMLTAIKDAKLFPEINWDVVVDSCIEKMAKPNAEIYELAQRKTGFKAEEILFIDNGEKNLIIPRKLGWKTFLYDTKNVAAANALLSELFL